MFKSIKLSQITLSKENPRRQFPKQELTQLKASIGEHGVLEPILVIPKNGKFELVFGERRYRACKELGLETIPAEVRKLSSEEALGIRLVENLQRQDLNPVEEAMGFKQLMKSYQLTPKQIADRVSKSLDNVNKRLALLELEERHQKMILEGKLALGHGLLLLRLKNPKERSEFAKKIAAYGVSVSDAQEYLERDYALRIDQAPFDPKDCEDCPCRSGNQKLLFEGRMSKEAQGYCTDRARFMKKIEAWKKEQEKALKARGCAILASESDVREEYGNKAVQLVSWQFDQRTVKRGCAAKCSKAIFAWGSYSDENNLKIFCIDKPCRTETFELKPQPQGQGLQEVPHEQALAQKRAVRRDNAARHYRQQFIVGEAAKRLPKDVEVLKKILLYHLIKDTAQRSDLFKEIGFLEQTPIGYYYANYQKFLRWDVSQAKLDEMLLKVLEVVFGNYTNTDAEYIAQSLSILPEQEFLITKEYLNTFTKEQLVDLAKEIGLLVFLMNSKQLPEGNLASRKKGEITALFLETGFNLQGKVPKEIKELYTNEKQEAESDYESYSEEEADEQEDQEELDEDEDESDDEEDLFDDTEDTDEPADEDEDFYEDPNLQPAI